MAKSSYKMVVTHYIDENPVYVNLTPYFISKRYSQKEFNINRFRNTLIVKESNTYIYKKFGVDHKPVHFSIEFMRGYCIDTPKDLLKLVFSLHGKEPIEIIMGDRKYFCVHNSLFAEVGYKSSNRVVPVFLSTIKDDGQLGIMVFSSTLQYLPSDLSKIIMGNLIPLICNGGGTVNIEQNNNVCEWSRPDLKAVPFTLSSELGFQIAKYYEEIWRNG